jgi:hypothetical protein
MVCCRFSEENMLGMTGVNDRALQVDGRISSCSAFQRQMKRMMYEKCVLDGVEEVCWTWLASGEAKN